ncbi:MAG: phospholipase D family protein [Rhodobacteraceae bacterium]|nr:phospholipase D family protein [Paracoccaceae bacterium]
MKYELVTQMGNDDPVFACVFGKAVNCGDLDRLDVAVAYATVTGIPQLMDAIDREIPVSRWAVGIDDAVSQPAAIEQIRGMPGSEVRLASGSPHCRFHPKIYQLWSSTKPHLCVSYVGSGNFTSNGLLRNAEAGVVLSSENVQEATSLRGQWQSFWDIAHPLTQTGLDLYKAAYNAARTARAASDKKVKDEVLDEDTVSNILDVTAKLTFDGTPQSATVAWLECGTASAGGRDLEFPAPIVPYFRLEGERVERNLRTPAGAVFNLTYTRRQDNGMWRVLLSGDAINSATGRPNLRPVAGGKRSDLAIVFKRSSDAGADFDIGFVVINSPEYDGLIKQTRHRGELKTTRGPGGRKFGYY